ncbi:uncharacterized protein [Oscarella lobularis]|uniref:uncharacterized protein n=1 Tax=Oscarella lobularis TaxID=121494 RepID=UPI00331387F6
MANSKTKPVESLDGGEFDAALPKGIYTLQPNLYHGYLTYTKKGVTGRGTKPKEGKCQWTISKSVTGKQTIRTLVRNATNPYLKIENNALQTAPNKLSPPSSYDFRALNVRSDETDSGSLVREEEPKMMKFQSDPNQSHYIGVDESGFVVPPAIAGSNPKYARFTTTKVVGFSSPSKDLDQEIVQIVSTGTDKAISIESKEHVFLSTKDKETSHLKAMSSVHGNVRTYTFQGVKYSSLHLRIRDGKMIAHKKPTSFAILKATVPGEETENDVYVLYSPAHHEFVSVKEDGHLELDPNPLPPSGSSKPLTNGPAFFHIFLTK